MENNTQPPEQSILPGTNGGQIDIVNVWETIQGEGPASGRPAVFIRLAGCNIRCHWCDTDYTANRRLCFVNEILSEVAALRQPLRADSIPVKRSRLLVVLTGGEPFRQPISSLVAGLSERGYEVQIETNGTLYPGDDFPFHLCSIVCSPKSAINPKLMPKLAALKYVLTDGQIASDGLPTRSLGNRTPGRPDGTFTGEVYIQPMDAQDDLANRDNRLAALSVCRRFGYRLSLQVHKLVGAE